MVADSGHSVLIVEDETLLALMLEDLLSDIGHHVMHADSLPDALALVECEHFDAAILDIDIRGKDVFPVAARLRELHTPFVFVSARHADRLSPEFSQEQLLAKPYTIAQVQQSLDRMLAD
ncbi:response regulator [Lysobacter niabensis]|uniref:response regulator n=1 Tax=Agrilutibacter niabensis TaxID=380628 RepID=UPI003609EFCC